MSGTISEPAWDEGDLEARLCRALDLAKRVIAWFASAGYADSEAPANSFHPEKPIAETAMLLYAASGVRHLSPHGSTRSLSFSYPMRVPRRRYSIWHSSPRCALTSLYRTFCCRSSDIQTRASTIF